jgi:hypothetical protein
MRINLSKNDVLAIDTRNGSFFISVAEGCTNISMYDHFDLEVHGNHKETPLIVLKSEEWPTRLKIEEPESKWLEPLKSEDE